jgi:streptomycin 3"-adenylyltransferase
VLLLEASRRPVPIEISFLSRRQLSPWRYPTPFDLHYSESWRERYKQALAGDGWHYRHGRTRTDPDLAAHITLLRARGSVLIGPPIDETFPLVPREDYLASILADYQEARAAILARPVYGVLNMARVYRFLVDGSISSKDGAGEWALTILPPEVLPAVRAALAIYRGEAGAEAPSPQQLERFMAVVESGLPLSRIAGERAIAF